MHCRDLGSMVIVEVNDPGIKGARDVWVEKKAGDAMPPCDESDRGRTPLSGAEGFGSVAGAKGDFVFVTSSDGFGDRMALRVFQLSTGDPLFETELSTQQPIALTVEGKSLWLRLHRALPLTCEPHGETAAQCWKEFRESGARDQTTAL